MANLRDLLPDRLALAHQNLLLTDGALRSPLLGLQAAALPRPRNARKPPRLRRSWTGYAEPARRQGGGAPAKPADQRAPRGPQAAAAIIGATVLRRLPRAALRGVQKSTSQAASTLTLTITPVAMGIPAARCYS